VFAAIDGAAAMANVNDVTTIVVTNNLVLAVILQLLENIFYKKSCINFL
jgi:hypothetical protein